jgi:hypothetical protein
VKWVTRSGVHIDRAACAWLIRRFLDPDPEFLFVADPAEVPDAATAFDMRGAVLSHHTTEAGAEDCTFETILRRHELTDPDDERYDAPEAAGLDVVVRGLSMVCDDRRILDITGSMFDGLYEYHRRSMLLGREPA